MIITTVPITTVPSAPGRRVILQVLKALIAAIAKSASALSGLPAAAQGWPQRTVKFILPLGLGSGTDIAARLVAEKLSARWGQPVVVENRPGGDG
jgi:tripartite-type tricarboxylate transporter receptor subunit TctC